ncbi:MAG TPA: PEGA domain-containing protein [Kofleriaceae bacterium]|jgi:hypothetical protein|nr:PEGA domain-containing protein [Kofleriaceae bacterium]
MTIARLRAVLPWSLTLVLAIAAWSHTAHAQGACPGLDPKHTRYAVKIDSAPQGAAIYVDSKSCPPVGVTPWDGKLNAGDYTIVFEAPGYEPASKPFKVARLRRVQELFVPLVKRAEPPKIDVRADADRNVSGATVVLDGQPQGQAPMVLTTTAGRHQVVLQKVGFEDYSAWLEVKDNQVQTFAPTIKEIAKPKYGTVVVEADVTDAEVYIDGNKHPDNTPAVISNVVEGVHVIELRKAGQSLGKKPVEVKPGEPNKVRFEVGAGNGGVGVIRVLSDAQGARAFIDGIDMGPVPVDIKDIKAGEHIVQVKAQGFQPSERHVTVTAGGSQIVKFDLNTEAAGDQGLLTVHSNMPKATVSIDGADVGMAPQEKKRVAPGVHSVLVRLDGYKQFEQKVQVDAGQTTTVQADLKAVGRLRVLSTPPHAMVMINGLPAGPTPLDTDVEVGETVVRIEQAGFQPFEQTLTIQGGKTEVLTRELSVAGPSEAELAVEQRALSSFGARVLPRGRSTADVDIGYPYFTTARITVGAGRIPNFFGFDATVAVRSMLARTEIGLGGRMTVVDNEPFAAAAFTNLWWGSKLLDDSKRNGVTWDLGGIVSLTALTHATISGRAYVELWSDRHCPAIDNSMPNHFEGTDPIGVCTDFLGTKENMFVPAADNNPIERARVRKLIGTDMTGPTSPLFDRENGARFLLSITGEIAFQQEWNIYFILEGAPFQQSERALFTSMFSGSMADNDYRIYARTGLTYKF